MTAASIVDPDAPSLVWESHDYRHRGSCQNDCRTQRLKAVVKAKGNCKRYLIFDPTDERTPVGNLESELQARSYGILAAGPASQIIALPVLDPDANGTEEKGSFTLSADGTLTGSVDTSSLSARMAPIYASNPNQVHRRQGAPRVLGEDYVAGDTSRCHARRF